MPINADLNTLKIDVDKRIDSFKKKRSNNKKKAGSVVVFSAILSAVTTILIGAESIWSEASDILSTIALITSASVSIIAAWDAFFNHKKLWIIYTEVLSNLYEIRDDIKHMEAKGYSHQNLINELYKNYKITLREVNQEWKTIRNDPTDEN